MVFRGSQGKAKEMLEKCWRNAERISEGLKRARGNAKEMLEESQRIPKIARDLKDHKGL